MTLGVSSTVMSWAFSSVVVPTGMNDRDGKGPVFSPFPLVNTITYKSHLTSSPFASKSHLYEAKDT